MPERQSIEETLDDICKLMHSYPGPWWIAGGWAIDLHLGYQSRSHHDMDIAVLRRDQERLREHLCDWSFRKVVNGRFEAWTDGDILELPIHELHAERQGDNLEFLLNESEGDHWLFRRNRAVSISREGITGHSTNGTPYLSPEIVLLYKAKSVRPHDQADFDAVLPTLKPIAKGWLGAALRLCHPQHDWIERLR